MGGNHCPQGAQRIETCFGQKDEKGQQVKSRRRDLTSRTAFVMSVAAGIRSFILRGLSLFLLYCRARVVGLSLVVNPLAKCSVPARDLVGVLEQDARLACDGFSRLALKLVICP